MKKTVLLLSLMCVSASGWAETKSAVAVKTSEMKEAPAADGSKPLALPDTSLVDRVAPPSNTTVTQICTTSEGTTYKQTEKGYNDCLSKAQASSDFAPHDPRAKYVDPTKKKDSAGFSLKFGK